MWCRRPDFRSRWPVGQCWCGGWTWCLVECIARAYLTGGGLAEYQRLGSVSGVVLAHGLVDGSRLPEPVFTPTTKAPVGQHDLPMTAAEVASQVGDGLAADLADLTCRILARGNEIAAARGVLIADTKVEYGLTPAGEVVLADEVLTPDSSRFWPADASGSPATRSRRTTSSTCATG